jgi:hypothetical protein
MLAARDFAFTVPALAELAAKQRDEDSAITPEGEAPKRTRLIITAQDTGRAVRAGHVPIRTIRLEFEIRANAKVPVGKADPFAATCGALEQLLDTSNLKEALDSPENHVAVMLATRVPGNGYSVQGDIRLQRYVLEVKAVKLELTIAS